MIELVDNHKRLGNKHANTTEHDYNVSRIVGSSFDPSCWVAELISALNFPLPAVHY